MWRLALCGLAIIGGWVVGPASSSAADETPLRVARVKGASVEMRQLIREVDRRSPTARTLIDEIGRSNAIVMIAFGFCHDGRFRSCVAHVEGDDRQRHIRILVSTRTLHDRLLATIAHELHHALEIIREPDVTNAEAVLALYRRIGAGACASGRSEACETETALAIEATVQDELARVPSGCS